jgi:16S rRNA G527 N7-methylase RsmG
MVVGVISEKSTNYVGKMIKYNKKFNGTGSRDALELCSHALIRFAAGFKFFSQSAVRKKMFSKSVF